MADFRQFYGIDLPIGDDEFCDLPRAAMLWAALPRESRTARRLDPSLAWGDGEYLMHSIEYSLRMLVWMGSKDGERNRNRPKPWETPSQVAASRDRADRALANKSEIDEILGIENTAE